MIHDCPLCLHLVGKYHVEITSYTLQCAKCIQLPKTAIRSVETRQHVVACGATSTCVTCLVLYMLRCKHLSIMRYTSRWSTSAAWTWLWYAVESQYPSACSFVVRVSCCFILIVVMKIQHGAHHTHIHKAAYTKYILRRAYSGTYMYNTVVVPFQRILDRSKAIETCMWKCTHYRASVLCVTRRMYLWSPWGNAWAIACSISADIG